MSTRCQIRLYDSYDEVWFYRHSDGYPEGVLPSLNKFLSWIKEGRIRNNVEQSAGWLVILGYAEYREYREKDDIEFQPGNGTSGWKVGAYEPCTDELHGDIEYMYHVNVKTQEIKVQKGREITPNYGGLI